MPRPAWTRCAACCAAGTTTPRTTAGTTTLRTKGRSCGHLGLGAWGPPAPAYEAGATRTPRGSPGRLGLGPTGSVEGDHINSANAWRARRLTIAAAMIL